MKQRRRRPSLEEEAQQRTRDHARVELCRAHGIDLILVDLTVDNPKMIFQDIDMMLSRAGQRIKATDLLSKISQARATASTLARQIQSYGNFKLYADLWEDRQYQMTAPSSAPAPANGSISFTLGMEVEHTTFGPGVVIATTPSGNDTLVTVDFITAGTKNISCQFGGRQTAPPLKSNSRFSSNTFRAYSESRRWHRP